MKCSTWQGLKPILANALDRTGAARSRYIEQVCAGRGHLRSELDSLLKHADVALDDFLEYPAALPSGPAPAEPDWTDRRVGPFRVIRRIGGGGMGQVFLAERDNDVLGRRVAIKTIRRDIDSPALRRRFDQERRLHAGLCHPFIARMLDRATLDDQPCMVLEHIEGPSIDVFCRNHRLSFRERAELFAQLCAAVQHVHAHSIVHRDIKPDNVMIAPNGQPKLLDFGIAEPVDHGTIDPEPRVAQHEDLSMFTPECAAPEQLRNEPATRATDIYGLGLLLYRLLTGKSLQLIHRSAARLDRWIEDAQLAEDMTWPIAEDRQRLKHRVDRVLLKALAREPADRYDSAREFSHDLCCCLAAPSGPDSLRHR